MSLYPAANAYYWNTRATSPRLVKPFILAAIHITGNPDLPSAMQEAVYANRFGSNASFTFVVNRNGSVVQCLHPEWQTPWTNGSWGNPNRSLWTVNYALSRNIGANDSTFLTCENVGYEPSNPITSAQVEALAHIVAWGSKKSGIPINRNTVLGHRDYNSITKPFCPTTGSLNALLDRIIDRAIEIKRGTSTPDYIGPMGGFPVRFSPVYDKDAVVKDGHANIRSRPVILKDDPNKYVLRQVPEGRRIRVLGKVPGTKVNGLRTWLVWWNPFEKSDDRWDGRLQYIHRSQVKMVERKI